MHCRLLAFIFASFIAVCIAENNVTETDSTVTNIDTTTTLKPENASCEANSNDCKACVSNTKCYFCETDKMCRLKSLKDDDCDLTKINYLTCRVNFQYLIIGLGVFAGIVFLVITIFCCYCCCKRKSIKVSKDELKWARQREERKQIAAERKKERAERTEEIRKKYGLVKDSNPYQRFDA